MGHLERKERERINMRENIMTAAITIAANEGWEAVTLRKIASAIEYTAPAVYKYFKSKTHLLQEIALLGIRKLSVAYTIARKSEDDHRKALKLFSFAYWDFAFENKEIYQLTYSYQLPFEGNEPFIMVQKVRDLFTALVPNNNELLVEELMVNWISLMHGFVFNSLRMGLPPELQGKADPREMLGRMIDRFLKGI